MKDFVVSILALALYVVPGISYLHGLYLALHEGFFSFVLVALIFPWGIIKGFIGFF